MGEHERVDAVIAGARCAGAPLAMLLARAGKRVVVVDPSEFPSDQPMSTHFIMPYGMAVLDELGLGDKVRAFAPPVPQLISALDDIFVRIRFAPGEGGSCPRRTDLDSLLVNEARAAGADVRMRTKLVDVLRDGERVVGAVVEHDGERYELRADVVVGADGRNSTVARLVDADEYHGYDGTRAAYWAYWPRPDWYGDDERYQGGAAIVHTGDHIRAVFPTNRDELLVAVTFPLAQLDAWRGNYRQKLLDDLRAHPFTGPVAAAEPISKVLGITKARLFFRQAAGPGWALVGDAGLFKDPTPGLGISDAFRDARALADAIVAGGDLALERYWRERDVASIELFAYARDLGEPGYNNALNRVLFAKIAASETLQQRMIALTRREVSPFAALKPGEVLRWTLGALLRGRFGVLGPLFAAGKLGSTTAKELRYRRKLAEGLRSTPLLD